MREVPLNKEARFHRLENQRRIVYSLIEKARSLLVPGVNFTRSLNELFRAQGKFGSSDRRLYRELIYTYIRFQPWLDSYWEDRDRALDALIQLAAPTKEITGLYPTLRKKRDPDQDPVRPYLSLGYKDSDLFELLPRWFVDASNKVIEESKLPYLFSRTPLWLRIQKDPNQTALDELRKAFDGNVQEISYSERIPRCIQAPPDFRVTELPSYLEGRIEIQDISSQILLQLLPSEPKGKWFDACAGAGGKTLQLASMTQPNGSVVAYDPRQDALNELQARVTRAGFRNVKASNIQPTGESFDGVLVDAPCSASGTWRRHPFLMRQTREQDVQAYAKQQLQILRRCAPLVKSGGTLVYCTCSLSSAENQNVRQSFLEACPQFEPLLLDSKFGLKDQGEGILVPPHLFNGDGLYVTAFRNR